MPALPGMTAFPGMTALPGHSLPRPDWRLKAPGYSCGPRSAVQPQPKDRAQLFGFDWFAYIIGGPGGKAFSRSPFMALAVTAMIGRPLNSEISRMGPRVE